MKIITTLICLLLIMGDVAFAASVESGNASGNQLQQGSIANFGPPPEAYAACKSKKAGDSASLVNPKGETITATCRQEGNQLVLRPTHPKGQSGAKKHDPPPEAYQACKGKSAGSVAQFVNPRGETVKGMCAEDNGIMVIRPDSNKGNKSTKLN